MFRISVHVEKREDYKNLSSFTNFLCFLCTTNCCTMILRGIFGPVSSIFGEIAVPSAMVSTYGSALPTRCCQGFWILLQTSIMCCSFPCDFSPNNCLKNFVSQLSIVFPLNHRALCPMNYLFWVYVHLLFIE